MKIQHPYAPITNDIPDDQAQAWLAAGWRQYSDDQAADQDTKSAPKRAPATKTPRASRAKKETN